MATELSEQLTRPGHKAELLVTRYSTLRADNDRLREEVLELQAQLTASRARIEKLEIELESLRLSSAIAPDTESAVRAARHVVGFSAGNRRLRRRPMKDV